MFLVINNGALKSFVDRLAALKDSYSFKLVSMAAFNGSEIFCIDVNITEDQLAGFAEDVKFGYGKNFKIKHLNKKMNYDYQTDYFVELDTGEHAEESLLQIRKLFNDANVNYRALEYQNKKFWPKKIRAYVSNKLEQEALSKLIA